MAQFSQITPNPEATNVSRTSGINFTILDDAYGVQINTLSVRINGIPAILNNNFINGYSGNVLSGSSKYVVGVYPKSPYFNKASEVSIVLGVRDGYNSLITQSYSFYTIGYNSPVDAPIPTTSAEGACNIKGPFFPPTDLGLKMTTDEGTGTEIGLEWLEANPNNSNNVVFYNIYVSTNRDQVYDGYPEYLSEDTSATIGGLRPGDQYFFGVRATEFNPDYITLSGREQVGLNLYRYPLTQLDGYISESSTSISVVSGTGFPNYGIILIGSELIRYTKSGNIFSVIARGYNNSFATGHGIGNLVRLYVGNEDANIKIVQNTPTFQKPNYAITYVHGDGYGDDGFRDGYDGYAFTDGYLRIRQKPYDNITGSLNNNDNSGNFPRYDYCGTYRAISPASFMKGQCVGSYFGGAQVRFDSEGNRHLVKEGSVRNHMLQREELLLESTGEPVVLLRRLWTGIRCHCVMLRREHPDARCPTCLGVGYVAGYTQVFNSRRSDRRILIRVDPATDDTNIVDRGIEPAYEPSAWTLAYPGLRDRDVIVRFNPNNTESFRYEILNVDRVRAFFAQTGAQKFRIKRFPKTDSIYQYPILRDASPQPTSISTSVSSAAAIASHYHGLIVPDGTDLNTFSGPTMVSEGHNHIIINGVIQPAAGHTHSL